MLQKESLQYQFLDNCVFCAHCDDVHSYSEISLGSGPLMLIKCQ